MGLLLQTEHRGERDAVPLGIRAELGLGRPALAGGYRSPVRRAVRLLLKQVCVQPNVGE